nr:MAG TPA: hypothetical protein [Caudoviricetes sp.]
MFNIFTTPLLLYLIIGLISPTDVVPRKRYLCQTDYAEYYEGSVYYCCCAGHSASLLSLNIQSVFNLPQTFLYICNLQITKRAVATTDIVIDFNTFLMD